MRNDVSSYLVLFCALVAVRNPRIHFQTALSKAPLSGRARRLAEELAKPFCRVAFDDPLRHTTSQFAIINEPTPASFLSLRNP